MKRAHFPLIAYIRLNVSKEALKSYNGKAKLTPPPAPMLSRNTVMPNTGNAFEPAQQWFEALPCILPVI